MGAAVVVAVGGTVVVVVGGVEADTEGIDAGVAVEAESLDDACVVADEIGVESDGGGDSGAGGFAVAFLSRPPGRTEGG